MIILQRRLLAQPIRQAAKEVKVMLVTDWTHVAHMDPNSSSGIQILTSECACMLPVWCCFGFL